MPLQTQAEPTTRLPNPPVANYLTGAIFFFFGLFAILLPWSIKGARYAWMAAFCIWVVSLIVERKRLYPQPLALPLLAYIVLSGLSCVFVLRTVHELAAHEAGLLDGADRHAVRAKSGTPVAGARSRTSAAAVGHCSSAGFTAWQYLRGIGLKVA